MITPDFFRRRLVTTSLVALLLAANTAAPAAAGDKKPAPYALIFGTVYGPDDRPLYGAAVKIRRADKKKAQYELMSDHRGEFAQRVPPGPADYVVWIDARLNDGKKDKKEKKEKAKGVDVTADTALPGREAKVHINAEERVDISLHLRE
ncbi:MAG TPA: hypothetical protein VFA60_09730 [Terriglobales bacterium]|nr:hypothetical protein [Terriglobales bacterium]